MRAIEDVLIRHGSVQSAAREIGEEAASEALYSLTQRAPEEMRASWPMVLSWARLQQAYEMAEAMGDAIGMSRIVEKQQRMLKELY